MRPAGRDPPGQRLAQGDGLLVDLLEHEVLVAALLGGLGRPVDDRHRALHRASVEVRDLDAGRPHVRHVALLEEDDAVGVGKDRGDVARDEALLAVQADHERHVLARPDEAADLAPVHHHQRVRALGAPKGGADRIGEVAPVGLLHEMGDGLRVRLGRERVAAGLEPVPELLEVLDDPVVDHRDVARAVLVRVGVEVVGAPVGRPSRVRKAERGVGRPVRERRLQVGELAGPLLDEHLARLVHEGDPGGVVAAVLEAPQALDEDGASLAGTRVADDSAHVLWRISRWDAPLPPGG